MRLPTEAQLSDEQREICFARAEGTILVTGPPGSGKTVVAHFRSRRLEKRGEQVSLVMYNHVLRAYTGQSTTFYKWVASWWRRSRCGGFPITYRDDGEHPRKVWDFRKATERAKSDFAGRIQQNGHWGHLVVDEAQDFGADVHTLLFAVQNIVFGDPGGRPSLMLLADENQRISDDNATIDAIRGSHMLRRRDTYELKRNYRNTRPISLLAAAFYVGLKTGIPEFPDVDGDPPLFVWTSNLNEAVERIAAYVRLNADQEIGVLVYHDKLRRKFFNRLKSRLESDGVSVQTYHWRERELADELKFDEGGVVTVLSFASAKGLEFDTVFLPELQDLPLDSIERDTMRMNLYVMISRARRHLFLMSSSAPGSGSVWEVFGPHQDLFEQEGP